MSDLVINFEDWFSHVTALMIEIVWLGGLFREWSHDLSVFVQGLPTIVAFKVNIYTIGKSI